MTTQPENQTETEVQTNETTTPPATFPRVGKIARLPKAIRDELNARLDAGEGGEPLLEWLNQLPETRHLLELEFAGKPISKQNLSEWRRGGFAEWQLRRSLLEVAGETREHAKALHAGGGRFLIDDVATAFTAHYNHLLMRWNGELSEEFQAKLRVFTRIRKDLREMQRDAHWAFRDSDECEQLEAQAESRRLDALKYKAMGPQRAAELRMKMVQTHGVKGARMAEILNTLEFGDPYPSFFKDGEASEYSPENEDDFIEEEPESEPPRKRPSRRKRKKDTQRKTSASKTVGASANPDGDASPAHAQNGSAAQPKNPESQTASQATAKSGEPVAVETTSDANAPIESSKVKPLSETVGSRPDEGCVLRFPDNAANGLRAKPEVW